MTSLSLATRARKFVAGQSILGCSGLSRNSRRCSGSWLGMITTTITMAHTKISPWGSEGKLASAVTGPTLSREGHAFLKSVRNHTLLTRGSERTVGLYIERLSLTKETFFPSLSLSVEGWKAKRHILRASTQKKLLLSTKEKRTTHSFIDSS